MTENDVTNVFESFYRSLLLEVKGVRNAVKRTRKNPVSAWDDNDFYLKSKILSDDDNKFKTDSIISFLLSSDLFRYFVNNVWPYYKERLLFIQTIKRKYGTDGVDIKSKIRNLTPDDFFAVSPRAPKFREALLKFFTVAVKDNKLSRAIRDQKDSKTLFDWVNSDGFNIFIQSSIYAKYIAKLNQAASFQKTYVKELKIAKDPTIRKEDIPLPEKTAQELGTNSIQRLTEEEPLVQIKYSNNVADREFIFNVLQSVTKNTNREGILDSKSTLIYLKNHGFTEDKLRDCVAFTETMNNSDLFEMNKKHINGVMLNVLDQPEQQNEFIKGEINSKKTLAEILGIPNSVKSYASKLPGNLKGYPLQKQKEYSNMMLYLFKTPYSINDFYIKLGKIINFAENTNEIDEDNFNQNLKLSKTKNASNITGQNGFDLVETIRKEIKDALNDLPPIFGKILTTAQLLFTKNDKDTMNLSVQQLYNPTTKQYIKFIIPTYDLMGAIDKERYRLSFFAIDRYVGNSTALEKSIMNTVSDVVYEPIVINSDLKKFENASSAIKNVLRNTQHINPTTIPSNQKKTFYVSEKDMNTFIDKLKAYGGKVIHTKDNGEFVDIGTYINENINFNTIVTFRGTESDSKKGGEDFAWKNTTISITDYPLDDGVSFHKYEIETPVYSVYTTGIDLQSLAIDDANDAINVITIQKEVMSELGFKAGDYIANESIRDGANILATKKILSLMFENNIANKFDKESETRKTVFGENNEKINSFIEYFVSNVGFSDNVKNPSSFDRAIELIRNFLAATQALITMSFIYYSLIISKSLFNSESNDAGKKTSPLKLTNEQYLARYCKIIQNNFAQRTRSLTARTLDGILNDTNPFHERTDFERPLDNILLGVLKSDYRFSQSEFYMSYLRKNNFQDAAVVSAIKGAIVDMIPAGIKQDVSVKQPNIDMSDEISDFNEIGHFVTDILKQIKDAGKQFNYNLDFNPSLQRFAAVLDSVENGSYDNNIKEALSETIKMYFAITYMMFLTMVVCKSDQNIFVSAKSTINSTEAKREGAIEEADPTDENAYAYYGDQARNYNIKTMSY